MLLENWRDFELENQDEESIKKVSNLMPKRVKKRRRIEQDEDAPGGADAGGWEEYFDYIFPEDEGAKPNLKLLAMAKMWKKQKEDVPVVPATMMKNEPEENIEQEEERIPISSIDPDQVDPDNPDADDPEMRNESSDEEEDESNDEDSDEPPKAKKHKNDDS